jgi:hypothetical protein
MLSGYSNRPPTAGLPVEGPRRLDGSRTTDPGRSTAVVRATSATAAFAGGAAHGGWPQRTGRHAHPGRTACDQGLLGAHSCVFGSQTPQPTRCWQSESCLQLWPMQSLGLAEGVRPPGRPTNEGGGAEARRSTDEHCPGNRMGVLPVEAESVRRALLGIGPIEWRPGHRPHARMIAARSDRVKAPPARPDRGRRLQRRPRGGDGKRSPNFDPGRCIRIG